MGVPPVLIYFLWIFHYKPSRFGVVFTFQEGFSLSSDAHLIIVSGTIVHRKTMEWENHHFKTWGYPQII